jgi:predicted restriction endonuclease
MNFKNWLLQIGKSESTSKKYSGAVSNSISKWAKEVGLVQGKLTEVSSIKEFSQLSNEIKKLDIFVERNTKGNSMYSNALNHYEKYLEDVYQEDIKDDIENILDDKAIGKTEKSQLISARLGQGKFRSYQINHWQCCALTGYSDTRFLVASHIKPWRDADNSERLDRYNGLLLLPNLDKVFDLGFITFNSTGEIIISKHLESFKTLGLSQDMKLDLQEAHLNYMSYHRDVVFEKRINP